MEFTSVERFLRWRLNVWRTGRKGHIEGAMLRAWVPEGWERGEGGG
jgi:hypothetical protein